MYIRALSMHALYVLLLVVNSDWFQILRSYTLLLKSILLCSSSVILPLCSVVLEHHII